MMINKVIVILFFISFLSFSFSSFSETFVCNAKDYHGNDSVIKISKKKLSYTMMWEGKDIPLKLILDNYEYLFLYVNVKHLTFLIGINKEKSILKFDIMDLDNNRKRSRVEGKCIAG